MGFGLGALIFNFILVAIVNPNNEKQEHNIFPKDVGDNLPFALRILSIIYAAIGLLGVAFTIPVEKKET
jgi:hypothetical protein